MLQGQLQPVLDSSHSFEDFEEAFQTTEAQACIGKSVITFASKWPCLIFGHLGRLWTVDLSWKDVLRASSPDYFVNTKTILAAVHRAQLQCFKIEANSALLFHLWFELLVAICFAETFNEMKWNESLLLSLAHARLLTCYFGFYGMGRRFSDFSKLGPFWFPTF